MKPAPSIKAA